MTYITLDLTKEEHNDLVSLLTVLPTSPKIEGTTEHLEKVLDKLEDGEPTLRPKWIDNFTDCEGHTWDLNDPATYEDRKGHTWDLNDPATYEDRKTSCFPEDCVKLSAAGLRQRITHEIGQSLYYMMCVHRDIKWAEQFQRVMSFGKFFASEVREPDRRDNVLWLRKQLFKILDEVENQC